MSSKLELQVTLGLFSSKQNKGTREIHRFCFSREKGNPILVRSGQFSKVDVYFLTIWLESHIIFPLAPIHFFTFLLSSNFQHLLPNSTHSWRHCFLLSWENSSNPRTSTYYYHHKFLCLPASYTHTPPSRYYMDCPCT